MLFRSGLLEPAEVEANLDMGIKTIYEMETEDGKVIRTTGNHPYLVRSQNEELTSSDRKSVV